MLKRLQSLLFEDEDDDEEEYDEVEEEEEEVPQPVKPRRRRRAQPVEEEEEYEELPDSNTVSNPAPRPASNTAPIPQYSKPAEQPQKPVMTRVEVTQTIPVQSAAKPKPQKVQEPQPAPRQTVNSYGTNESVFKKPASVPRANPRPIFDNQQPAFTPKQNVSSFGISADNGRSSQETVSAPRSSYQTQRMEAAPRNVQSKPAPQQRQQASVYEFRPVISPMFGVDEKDMNSVQYNPKKEVQNSYSRNSESTKVISPMYGTPERPAASKPAAAPAESQPAAADPSFYGADRQDMSGGVPEFSLDDILSARDEEFSRQSVFNSSDPARTPDIDETVVIDSNHFSIYDQQSLDFDRNK